MRWFWGGAILLLTAIEAAASGAIGCGAEDHAASFDLAAGVTHGMGAPTFNFRGDLEILDETVAEDLRRLSFEDRHLAQYWLDGDELRLLVFREREAEAQYGSVELTIRTKARGEEDAGSYEGAYEIEVYDLGESGHGEGKTLILTGEVSCFAE
ncbi:MAG: hypothetical protein K0S21_728 [Rhizobiaceae bacterium]|jgi:hypothetical protein|nr:hypothetical protein [Rhizobiaceae bacterium]